MRLALWEVNLDAAMVISEGGGNFTLYTLSLGSKVLPDVESAVKQAIGLDWTVYHINKIEYIGQMPIAFNSNDENGKLISQLFKVS